MFSFFNFVKESFNDLMGWLGFLPENSKILFLGLDNAGKTTLLHMLRDDRITSLLFKIFKKVNLISDH